MESPSLRSGTAGSRSPSARRSLAITVLLALGLALAAARTAAGRPEGSLALDLGTVSQVSQAAAAAKGAVSISPFSADIRFTTPVLTTARAAYGIGDTMALYTPILRPAEEHTAHLSGLRPDTTYRVRITVSGLDGGHGSADTTVHTAPLPIGGAAGMTGGALTVNGEPFFPFLVFGQCDTWDQSLARGVNVFQLGGCLNENEEAEAAAVAGRAFVATDAFTQATAPNQIGFTYDDEADEHGYTYETLPAFPSWQSTGRTTFLTLTNHFYSKAESLPAGKGMYAGLAKRADILGFDLYPLQVWCRYESFGDVYYAQRELDALVQGRPTYQWIETAPMQCPGESLKPTSQTVEAETWLAIAGGADGIGWFPWDPTNPQISATMKKLADEVGALQPALLAPQLPTGYVRSKGIFVGARKLNDAIYVIAVNASRKKVTAPMAVGGVADTTLQTLFEPPRRVKVTAGRFTDTFAPLQAHIYYSVPLDVAAAARR